MRGTRFLRAVCDLATERELESLLAAAKKLAARGTRASSSWIEITSPGGAPQRAPVRCTTPPSTLEARVSILGHDVIIGVTRLAPFTPQERERLEILARQVAFVAMAIRSDQPGLQLAAEVRDLRRRRIARALERHAGCVAAAARELGIARSHIYKIRESLRRRSSKCPR